MRPIKLKMQAFGPYAGMQELNMDELGETGIYAITGETGAGKTTIFDAIVYALYGVGSGQDRTDGKSLRAVDASPDVETRVELDFVSNGKKYHIERCPIQPLIKTAKQKLTMPDGTSYTSGITKKIENDILGVDKDQFCQIVMIAQGEFRELLRANTNQRIEIFRKIFKTDKYNKLALEFKRRSDEKDKELGDARIEIASALKTMEVEADSPLREEWMRLKNTEPDALFADAAAALAAQLVALDEEAHDAAEKALKEAKHELDNASKAFDEASRQAKKQQSLNELRTGLKRQQEQLADAKTAREAAEAKKPEIEDLGRAITTETNLLPKYDELDGKRAEQAGPRSDLETAEAMRDAAQKKVDDLQAEQDDLVKEAEGLKNAQKDLLSFSEKLNEAKATGDKLSTLSKRVKARDDAAQALTDAEAAEKQAEKDEKAAAEALAQCQAELNDLGNTELALSQAEEVGNRLVKEADELKRIKKRYEDYASAVKSCAAAKSVYQQKQSLATQKREEAGQLRQRYNANIAGILASDLAEGTPCPVCGSVHHPSPAALSADAVTAEAVDKAEAAAKKAEDEASKQASVCAAENEKRDGIKTQLVERMPDVLEADWPADIQHRQNENAAAQQANAGQLKAAREANERKQRLQKTELPKAQKAKEDATERLKKASEAKTKAKTDYKTAETEVINAANAADMPADWTPLDLSDALSENDRQQAAMKQGKDQAEHDIKRLDEIGKQQEQNRKSIDAQKETVNNQGLKIAELETSIKNGQQSIDALKAELPYPTKADCERAIDDKKKRKEELEGDIDRAKTTESQLKEDIANTKGQIKPLEDELKDAPPVDVNGAKATLEKAQSDFDEATKYEKAIDKRRSINAKQQKTLDTKAKAARELERDFNMMKDIYDTVDGKISGNHLKLEAFVQTSYFDRIINYAKRRLYHMSREQYEFQRRKVENSKKQGQIGLDLDVLDHNNGKTRAVGTLSGGEGFLAALSLALGMSDAIQASKASAVQLDAMFVDEGFGSLSESFLELVMDELNDTAAVGHRLIGVISHVDEVKDGIERRIEVEKSALGVSTAKIR